MRNKIIASLFLGLLHFVANTLCATPPNVVLIFMDDAGYGDFHPFGNPPYATPHVKRLAAEGGRFNRFFVPQAVCSASRAALLTGCYPERTKMFGALSPGEKGLDGKFSTMAEVFKKSGYATAIFGKWHLGEEAATRPAARGFDESAGLLLSNDMWDKNNRDPKKWSNYHLKFWTNDKVTCERVTPEFQTSLTCQAAQASVDFIQRHKASPFFLYVPFSMPHVPLYCSEAFQNKSGAGLYGDVIMELDDAIGQITGALQANGLEENTIVIMTSDNGPWLLWGNHAGQTPFREGKTTSFNGGTQSCEFGFQLFDSLRVHRIVDEVFGLLGIFLPVVQFPLVHIWFVVMDQLVAVGHDAVMGSHTVPSGVFVVVKVKALAPIRR